MHFSRRWLRLGLVPAMVGFISACGGSEGADQSESGNEPVAVSASPQPEQDIVDASEVANTPQSVAAAPDSKSVSSKLEPQIRPGVESPLDSAPDRISKHVGTRLFATGFEAGVSLSKEPESRSPYQYLSGGDIAGFRFPMNLWSAAAGWRSLIHADVGPETPMPVAEYASSSIKAVAGRGGSTRALSLHSKAKSPRAGLQEIAVKSAALRDEPVVFQRMWIKFDANTLNRARAAGSDRFYQMFWEVRAQPDFWLRLKLHHDDVKGLIWVAKASGLDSEISYWESRLNTVPVVLAAESSPAGWHRVEIWLDRSGGRFKVAIDGQTLVDKGGDLVGAGGNRIDDYRMMMVSSTVAPLAEVLFDDLEFWDAPPEDAWRH